MWEVILVLAVLLFFVVQLLLRKLPSRVHVSLMLLSGVALVLLVLLAPGAETWHRFGLIAVGSLFIVRAVWGLWSARTPTEVA